MNQFPPSAAERWHVHKMVKPEGAYEHACPQKPMVRHQRGGKPFRVMHEGKTSASWFLWRPGAKEYIKCCPWCTEVLPLMDDLKCTCGADDAHDHNGYQTIIVRQDCELPKSSFVNVRVRAYIVEYLHEDDCPVRGMKTRGAY